MTLPRLYAIVDDDLARARGWTAPVLARACLEGGARLLQIRAKTCGAAELLAMCEEIAPHASAAGATLVVNDRGDVARLIPGAGVHVGQDDLAPGLVRRVVGPDVVVGFSTHSTSQVDAALAEPITYLAVGPVFGTTTKATGYDAVGLDLVRYAVQAASQAARKQGSTPVPVVGIGGITLERAASVIAAGAASVAVISDVLEGNDPAGRVRRFLQRLG